MTPTLDDWAALLKPVAASVRYPPDETDFRARVAACAFAMPDADPAWLRNVATQREACLRFERWPAVADIRALLGPHYEARQVRALAAAEREQRRALPPQPVATAEQRAATLAALKALAADVATNAKPEPRKPRPRAAYLTGEALAVARTEGITTKDAKR
jgi:hypothetical protein